MEKQDNYTEEFRVLTEEELYHIYSGETDFPVETKLIAEVELKKRGFDFNNMPLNMLRWELEGLKTEIEEENKIGNVISGGKYSWLFISFFGLLLIVIILYNFSQNTILEKHFLSQSIMFAIAIFLLIWGFLRFIKNKRYREERAKRIAMLEEKLQD